MENDKLDFSISSLGVSEVQSPISLSKVKDDFISDYTSEDEYILYDIEATDKNSTIDIKAGRILGKAGPRERIYFSPEKVHAAIVTCGGLCPGLNDVIGAVVMCLWYRYGVRHITGIRNGYRGLLGQFNLPFIKLNPEKVADIHNSGGTILGSSRGYGKSVSEIVDGIEKLGVNMLFAIGGDGTQRALLDISQEAKKRKLDIAFVGVPKTIDNDLSFVQRSFGFETAVAKAVEAVLGAHAEARGAINGIGIVKLMGRQSGFITAHTALASSDVNYVLVPEVPFDLDGGNGLLAHLEKRLQLRGHAVIVVSEGAGQNLMEDLTGSDASGNKLLADIGIFLKEKIAAHFRKRKIEIGLKYIDPSYIIRSMPANPGDSIYCTRLGANAVHAAMAGKTELIVGMVHNYFVHIPIRMAVSERNVIDPDGVLWRDVIEATGQPQLLKN